MAEYVYNKLEMLCFLVWMTFTMVWHSSAEAVIKATAPLSDVEAGGILSLHCQVTDIQPGLEISLFRTVMKPNGDEDTDRISVDSVVTLTEDDRNEERIFLAVRQLEDGSVVHFLSIMDVSRYDSGSYACSLNGVENGRHQVEMSYSTVPISVMYFPSEEEPKCSYSSTSDTLTMDSEIVLNCSSEKAYPTVTLSWSTGTSTSLHGGSVETRGDRVYSVLRVRPSGANTVYLCTVQSVAFPGRTHSSCHVGPLKIDDYIPDSNQNNGNTPVILYPSLTGDQVATSATTFDLTANNNNPGAQRPVDCRKVCASSNASVTSIWIIATIAVGSIALVFLLLILILLYKHNKAHQTNNAFYVAHHPKEPMDQLYSELEYKRNQNMVYMALAKREKVASLRQHAEVTDNEEDPMETFRLAQLS